MFVSLFLVDIYTFTARVGYFVIYKRFDTFYILCNISSVDSVDASVKCPCTFWHYNCCEYYPNGPF